MRRARGHVSLIIKGPLKNAQRSAQRHGLSPSSCRTVDRATGRDIQCYVKCSTSTNSRVIDWYADNVQNPKPGRGHPPGTLLYHGALCEVDFGRRKRKPRRRRARR
jgi:hypothetical protein